MRMLGITGNNSNTPAACNGAWWRAYSLGGGSAGIPNGLLGIAVAFCCQIGRGYAGFGGLSG